MIVRIGPQDPDTPAVLVRMDGARVREVPITKVIPLEQSVSHPLRVMCLVPFLATWFLTLPALDSTRSLGSCLRHYGRGISIYTAPEDVGIVTSDYGR